MSESFLHYIWQLQYFNKQDLRSTDGELLSVIKTGNINSNGGPDFLFAKIKIGEVVWAGNIEIHIKGSDWYSHHHETDDAYENVVLHVVWENDRPVLRKNNTKLTTLELKSRVNDSLLKEYKKLINSSSTIACEKIYPSVDSLYIHSMLDRALMQRLETKAGLVIDKLKTNAGNWEETAYQLLAKNFGFKVNADAFHQLSKSVPYKIIQKQSTLLQIEALFFGQAGMLEIRDKDSYLIELFDTYHFLEKKFSMSETKMNAAQWKFLRMRPANFPTIKLAQLASLLFKVKNIFSQIISFDSYLTIEKIFSFDQSEYWQTHYRFGVKAKNRVPGLGNSSIQNIAINSIAPLLVAYGKYKDEQIYIDKALQLLQEIPAENNKVTRLWSALNCNVKNAFDSQALIELTNNFCMKRLCLNCEIGASILKPKK